MVAVDKKTAEDIALQITEKAVLSNRYRECYVYLMQQIFVYLQGEWEVVGQAPFTVLILVAIVGSLAMALSRHQASEKISNLESRVDLRDDKIADYERKLKGASPDEAAATIADLQRRLAALEPIVLTAAQSNSLLGVLRQAPGTISIVHDGGSSSSKKLHHQLADIFYKGGWQVSTSIVFGIGHPPSSGLGLRGSTESTNLRTVSAALSAAGIGFDLQPTANQLPHSHAHFVQAELELLVTTTATSEV